MFNFVIQVQDPECCWYIQSNIIFCYPHLHTSMLYSTAVVELQCLQSSLYLNAFEANIFTTKLIAELLKTEYRTVLALESDTGMSFS